MRRRICLSLCLVLAMGFSASEAQAGTWYLGMGLEFGQVSSEEKTLLDGLEGSSVALVAGHRFNPRISLDLCFSGPMAGDFMQAIISLGPRFDFLDLKSREWTPWTAVYISSHSLVWEDRDYSADKLGFSLGLGVDHVVSPKGVIQYAVRYHPFKAPLRGPGGEDLGTYDTETAELTVSYVHHYW